MVFFRSACHGPTVRFKIAAPRLWGLGQDLDRLLQGMGWCFSNSLEREGRIPSQGDLDFYPYAQSGGKKHVLFFHSLWYIKYCCLGSQLVCSPALEQLFHHFTSHVHQLTCVPEEKLEYWHHNREGCWAQNSLNLPILQVVNSFRHHPGCSNSYIWFVHLILTQELPGAPAWWRSTSHLCQNPAQPGNSHSNLRQHKTPGHKSPLVWQAKMFDPHTYLGGEEIRHQCVGRCLSSEPALKRN